MKLEVKEPDPEEGRRSLNIIRSVVAATWIVGPFCGSIVAPNVCTLLSWTTVPYAQHIHTVRTSTGSRLL
jgi:hypothetical protein